MLLFEPPNVGGWRAWLELVLDGDDAGAHEFRRNAGGQPEGAPRRRARNERHDAAGACSRRCSSADTCALRPGSAAGAVVLPGRRRRWTGSEAQLNTRAAGLARLLVGSSEYQLV